MKMDSEYKSKHYLTRLCRALHIKRKCMYNPIKIMFNILFCTVIHLTTSLEFMYLIHDSLSQIQFNAD